jgi:hypothetical protein
MSTARHVAHTPPRSRRSIPRILAVSSGGGHWVQLLRLRPALRGADLAFVTVNSAYQSDLDGTASPMPRAGTSSGSSWSPSSSRGSCCSSGRMW